MMTQTDVTSSASTTSSSRELSPDGMEDKANYRKSNKPLMEKKRRARINSCLSQLKSLVLQAMKKDNSQYSKLEKADILELTVKHLKNVQRFQINGMYQVPDSITKYRAGFNECANEVMRYLTESQGVNDDARARILSHLASILTPLNTLPIQQGHTPILPAPSHQQQLQQLQQLQLHHQQQQQQQQQQGVFLTSPTQILTIDTNNNQPMVSAYHNASTAVDKKNVLSTADSPTAFQSPIATGGSPSMGTQLPCIATMATTQLHLVPSTLPSGQMALVLAPHAMPAVNLYANQQMGRQHISQEYAKIGHSAIKLEPNHGTPQQHFPAPEEALRLLSNTSPVALVTKSSRSHHRTDHSKTGPYKCPASPYLVRSSSTHLSSSPTSYDQRQSHAGQRQSQSDPRQSHPDQQQSQSIPRQSQADPRQSQADPRQSLADPRQSQADPRQSLADPRQSQADLRQSQADPRQSQADGSNYPTASASATPKFPLSSVIYNYNNSVHNNTGSYNNVVRATSTWRPW
ncbi:unnamed protein product [Lymnaea stagnalis]|uniref:Uncharacterized protein n=1 Tax=Lymnaea stagnalis TaxID=6523 RepID=A0AAV2H283_LYMST